MTLVKALTQPYQFINNNHAANQQANKNSNFDEHVVNEKGLGNAGKATTENISKLNPNEVRFSQNTVSYNKRDRVTGEMYTYDDLVNSMKNDG